MKKSLIALAAASAFAAPAFAATSNVDVYGRLSFSVDHVDTNETAGDSSDLVTGTDNVSYIGFKGTEDLGGGMKAVWQIENQINATAGNTGYFGNRNTYVGLAGGFGEVRMGRHDTPYKLATVSLDPFADTIGDYNNIIGRSTGAIGSAFFDLRAAGTIAYITPTINGFHAAIAYVETKTVEAAGADNTEAWSAMGMYQNGPMFASLAYETHSGNGNGGATTTAEIDGWKLGLGYAFGDTKVGLVYDNIESDAAASASSRSAWYLSATHTMGPIVLKAAYGNADNSDAASNDGADFWALGMDYNLSKRTAVYAVYATLDNEAGAGYDMHGDGRYANGAAGKGVDGISVGIKHSF